MVFRVILLTVILLYIAPVCSADPVWGTNMPDIGEWTVGFRHNIVFKDKLRRDYGKTDSTQYFCDLSLGITEWLSLDGRLSSTGSPEIREPISRFT